MLNFGDLEYGSVPSLLDATLEGRSAIHMVSNYIYSPCALSPRLTKVIGMPMKLLVLCGLRRRRMGTSR